MDDIKGPIDTVSRLYQQLDEKISESGGLGNLFGLHRKFRDALEAITGTELVVFLSEIQRAKEALNRLQDEIIEIHALKQAFESRTSFLGSSKLRGEG
jgi:hypothetical protein